LGLFVLSFGNHRLSHQCDLTEAGPISANHTLAKASLFAPQAIARLALAFSPEERPGFELITLEMGKVLRRLTEKVRVSSELANAFAAEAL
jgi:hypothetical protein